MDSTEFSNQFDLLYNNITSNQAPGLSEYEKSVFLTKAQDEIVKNYFSPQSKGNNLQQGFDDSAKRQADFSLLIKTGKCTPRIYLASCTFNGETKVVDINDIKLYDNVTDEPVSTDVMVADTSYRVSVTGADNDYVFSIGTKIYRIAEGFPFELGEDDYAEIKKIENGEVIPKIDTRSFMYSFPTDVFIMVNETAKVEKEIKQVIPLRYDEYTRLMSKPYKRPNKNQVWRLMNSGALEDEGNGAIKNVELIFGPEVSVKTAVDYRVRYVRVPKPIILGDLDGLTINGYKYPGQSLPDNITKTTEGCELDPTLHEDILQRAVELAKAAWVTTGAENIEAIMSVGQRTE